MRPSIERLARSALRSLANPWCALTRAEHALPDFIIIGAQKAGTTSLYEHVAKHPGASHATVKEVHYFDNNFHRTSDWYKSHFPYRAQAAQKRASGEASPYYLFHPHAARRCHELLPNVKIIIMLRDPVARAFSHYHHVLRRGRNDLSFEAAIEREPMLLKPEKEHMLADETYRSRIYQSNSYVARGMYAEQISRWRQFYAAGQILVIGSEFFFENPESEYHRALRFLGLPARELPRYSRFNSGSYAQMAGATRTELQSMFAPHNRQLFDLLSADWPEFPVSELESRWLSTSQRLNTQHAPSRAPGAGLRPAG